MSQTKLTDTFERRINYLRVSVTDRCNLRCLYCMPEAGIPMLAASEILSFEEILRVVRISVGLGIKKVRVTGGEPLVRKNLATLVTQLSDIPGIEDLSLSTNAVALSRQAAALKTAGISRISDGQEVKVLETHQM